MKKWTTPKCFKCLCNDRGVSLIMAISIGLVLGAIGFSTMHTVIIGARSSGNYIKSTKAFWAAEAGLERALGYLFQQGDVTLGIADTDFLINDVIGSSLVNVRIEADEGNIYQVQNQYEIISSATDGDIQRIVSQTVQSEIYSDFAYTSHSEGSGINYFSTGDVIGGPMHSNDQIAIQGSPLFIGEVSSSAASFLEGPGYAPIFENDYSLRAQEMILPTKEDWNRHVRKLQGNKGFPINIEAKYGKTTELEFFADGTFTYSVWKKSGANKIYYSRDVTRNISDSNGLIRIIGDATGEAKIHGIIKGRITFYSMGVIKIIDDIVYEDADTDGNVPTDSENFFGIISRRGIIIPKTTANMSDIKINAAILTTESSFSAESYNTGPLRGTIRLHGSLAQFTRGKIGTTQSGYRANYTYDTRFKVLPLPWFPATGRFRRLQWQEK